tara:strand:+ start:529 stop:990 length:462 start_codon:yes stop_codon:yes gene_type:complete
MNKKAELKNKTEIIISTIEHSEIIRQGVGSWGNGYLEIPKEHFAYNYLKSHINQGYGFEGNFCGEEITYFNHTETGLKIGFDTLHSYNDESHDEEYVLFKCAQIKNYFNSPEIKKQIIDSMEHKIEIYKVRIKKTKEKVRQLKKEFYDETLKK